MNTTTLVQHHQIEALKRIIEQGGPECREYDALNTDIAELYRATSEGRMDLSDLEVLLQSCTFLADPASIMGHIRQKPYGYAGDFEIIDRIYTQEMRTERYAKWDAYALQHPAARAVRNRKDYFIKEVGARINTNKPVRLCNVASGPARDLFELLGTADHRLLPLTTCVDLDQHALSFAAELLHNYKDNIRFVHSNIFRYKPQEKFDLIWSAGLFDYFTDREFVFLLGQFREWLLPGGEIIVGNFNEEHNPSRIFMEFFGDWFLNHRSEHDLKRIALSAGFQEHEVSIGKEEGNINLFLHLRIS